MKLRNGVGILSAMLAGGSVYAADGVSVGGFVDAQYNWAKNDTAENVNTFSVPDGALYLNGKSGNTEVLVDIPFAASSTNADFVDFNGKGQAWAGAKYDSGLNWKLGQFDSTLKYEKNDSVDRTFSNAGIVKGMSPTVHRGFGLGYDFSDMLGVTLLVANPYQNSDTPGGAMSDGNPDMGAQVNANFDMFYVKLGGLFGKDVGADKNTFLFNTQAGFNVAALNIGLEFSLLKNTSTEDENKFGIGAHLGYAVDDMINVATRFEWTKLEDDKVLNWTVGPQFKLGDALTAKVDYTLNRTDDGTTDATNHIIGVAAVHRF